MKTFFRKILEHRKFVLALYFILVILCGYATTKVKVNSTLSDDLPPDSDSTIALAEMESQYTGKIPNAQMMVEGLTMREADRLEQTIRELDGVLDVTGIADQNLFGVPYDFLGEEAVKNYYRDGCALYSLTLDSERGTDLLNELRSLTDKKVSISGSFVDGKVTKENSGPEIFKVIGIVIVIAILLFMLTMDSWVTPFLLVLSLLAAVAINSGTNIIFGTISSVTNTAANVLQMGVSVDYFIFILHRYREYRETGLESVEAMAEAMSHSLVSVLASSLTTIIGFAALIFMRYRIGMDMGIVLSKGVAISLLCAFTLLPCMVLSLEKLITKTQHKPLLQSANRLAGISMRVMLPVMLVFLLLIIPALRLQSNNQYYYGSSHFYKDSHFVMEERNAIESVFGKKNTVVLLVPKGRKAEESALVAELKQMPELISITAYTEMLGMDIPYDMLPEDIRNLLISEDYSRMVLTLSIDEESEDTFSLLERVKQTAGSIFDDKTHLVGTSVSTSDLKEVISADSLKVNLIAVVAIFLVLLFSTRSLILPVMLTLCIEGSIWISMAYSTLRGEYLFYIGYLIVSSILLGSTVDYAILVTNRFREFLQDEAPKVALRSSISHSAVSILTSGLILISAGILLNIICTDQLTAQLGKLLARGTMVAILVVLFALPGFLKLYAQIKRTPR